jgi:predicted Zn-dependent protease
VNAPRSKAVYNLGIEAWENGHLEEAARALESLDSDDGLVPGFQLYWGALANVHHLLGNYRDALKAARKARAADPASWRALGWELGALVALGRTTEVMEHAGVLAHASVDNNNASPADALRETAEEMRAHGYPSLADSLWRLARMWYQSAAHGRMVRRDRLGWAQTLYALGLFEEAEAVVRELHQEYSPDVATLGLLGTIAARRLDTSLADEMMSRLAQMELRYEFGRPTYQRALIATASGNEALAMDLLREARRQGRSYQIWVHRELDLEGLRETPEYKSLLRPIALSLGDERGDMRTRP